jgi:beta-N-acetylhexosaminidase
MPRRAFRTALTLTITLGLVSCAGGGVQPLIIDLSGSQPPPSEPPTLPGMTLAEKVGQLFVVPASGVFLNEESKSYQTLRHHVVDNKVGGVIWFRSQVYGTAILARRLQELAKVPLLFSADLEAGAGMRFDDVMYGPWAMALAATGDVALAERRAKATAEEARALGIAQVFAPVADVNDNPDNPVINVRSFGENPSDVARFVAATVRGLEAGGVLATLKHFPGHGDTSTDSHRTLAVVKSTKERLNAVELVPFREGLKAGARSVMVAHLSVPALDPTAAPPLPSPPSSKDALSPVAASEVETEGTTPATLSGPITTDLLRKELGFGGLVVTDSMQMGGIVAHFETGEAAVRAILAGIDQILMSPDTDAAIAAVVAAVKSGRISGRRLDESVERILKVKKDLHLYEERFPPLDAIAKTVGSPAHEKIEAEIARRALTLVREEAGVLPLPRSPKLLSVVVFDEAPLIGPSGTLTAELAKRVEGNEKPRTLRLDTRSNPEEVKAVVDAARDADVILLSLFVRARSGAGKIAVPEAGKAAIPQLLASGKPVVAVAFGSPYLLREFPGLKTYLCAYGTQDVMQTAAVAALFGEAGFEGKLPVTLPGVARRGDGIAKPAVVR